MDSKRVKELAGLTEASDGSLPTVIIVTNPVYGEEELGDIMYEADPVSLFQVAKGTGGDLRALDIKLYAPEQREAARRDAEMRLSKL